MVEQYHVLLLVCALCGVLWIAWSRGRGHLSPWLHIEVLRGCLRLCEAQALCSHSAFTSPHISYAILCGPHAISK